MERKVLWPILVIGLALVVVPFAMGMPGKTAAGQRMLNNFRPIMQPAHVQTTADYYYKTFVPLRGVAIGGVQAGKESPQLIGALAQALKMTPAQVQNFLGTNFPAAAGLIGNLPKLKPVFEKVPGGLDFYKSLVTTMQANVNDYASVDSLPNFNLFTWFFVIPGFLLMLLSGYGLWHEGALKIHHHAHPTPA